jgi:phosphatidylglycerophosphate synthase
MLGGDENRDVAIVLVIGVLLSAAGLVLLINLLGAGDFVMRRVTSQSLGELAPGFAASHRGFRIYAVLVLAIGILCLGLAATAWIIPLGAGLLVLGAIAFVIASVIAIVGEVETYRALKR